MREQIIDREVLPKDNFFSDFARATGDRALTKWVHYFEVYERELARFRDKPISFLEIGVFRGGSVPMWKDYFRGAERLTFIDIDPACKAFEIEGTHVAIGSQADPEFLAQLAKERGPFDVILDDGSHINAHQIATRSHLWPHLSDGGLYMVEDCHTSYWPGFGGGHRAPGSFIEFAKGLIDKMHSWYSEEPSLTLDREALELFSLRVYDSIVVMEKRLKDGAPRTLHAKDGKVILSRSWMQHTARRSTFAGKDDS